MTAHPSPSHRPVVLEAESLTVATPSGRVLVRDLDLVLERDHVAIVGRNGAGKSSLLSVLAGERDAERGQLRRRGRHLLVPQSLPADDARSPGERRRQRLEAARRRGPDLLIADEPTEDLDIAGVDWLCDWLPDYPGALLVVSHHRQLLRLFEHFFVLEESGCRYFRGSFAELEEDLQERHERGQQRYASKLSHLEARQRHDVTVRRRRRRKKNLGRLHEEARGVSRARLGEKKRYAQNSQAKAARIRDDRLAADRDWVHTARRALAVRLPLALCLPELPADDGRARIAAEGVGLERNGRLLVDALDLTVGRDRLAVVGPNGVGKSTLLDALRGARVPSAGRIRIDATIGSITQGATNWIRDESLLETLLEQSSALTAARATAIIAAHAFPLGLALRSMASLSAGERTRAALIALFQQAPEIVILDEPTYSLDLEGAAALAAALARWRGGLVVASHDRGFLDDIGITTWLRLDHDARHHISAPSRYDPGVVSTTSPP